MKNKQIETILLSLKSQKQMPPNTNIVFPFREVSSNKVEKIPNSNVLRYVVYESTSMWWFVSNCSFFFPFYCAVLCI